MQSNTHNIDPKEVFSMVDDAMFAFFGLSLFDTTARVTSHESLPAPIVVTPKQRHFAPPKLNGSNDAKVAKRKRGRALEPRQLFTSCTRCTFVRLRTSDGPRDNTATDQSATQELEGKENQRCELSLSGATLKDSVSQDNDMETNMEQDLESSVLMMLTQSDDGTVVSWTKERA